MNHFLINLSHVILLKFSIHKCHFKFLMCMMLLKEEPELEGVFTMNKLKTTQTFANLLQYWQTILRQKYLCIYIYIF